jgi:hypothetical protein
MATLNNAATEAHVVASTNTMEHFFVTTFVGSTSAAELAASERERERERGREGEREREREREREGEKEYVFRACTSPSSENKQRVIKRDTSVVPLQKKENNCSVSLFKTAALTCT